MPNAVVDEYPTPVLAQPTPTFPDRKGAVREFANKSAASAASPASLEFQAVIKSAASAASRKPKSREGSSRAVPRGRRPPAEPPSALDLGISNLGKKGMTALQTVTFLIYSGLEGLKTYW